MYNIWFCGIINQFNDDNLSLEYIKLMYKSIQEKELKEYAVYICKDLGYEYDKIVNNQYCFFKNNSQYCLLFEEMLEEER